MHLTMGDRRIGKLGSYLPVGLCVRRNVSPRINEVAT
jgi:hypothetical protein